jgi:hypothetical protein
MRTTLLRTSLLALLLVAPAVAQVPDVRGLTFDVSMGLTLHGNVLDTEFSGAVQVTKMDPVPWTFDILPATDAPMDLTQIVLRTRLPTGDETPELMRFELRGTYDPDTGAIDVAGNYSGCHFWKTPFLDDAGVLDAPACVWVSVRDPHITLHAQVSAGMEDAAGCILGFDILGGTALHPQTVAAEVELNASLIAWLPGGATDPSEACYGPFVYSDVTAAITGLHASVREVFGDMNEDAFLTQADVVEVQKMLGPVLEEIKAEADLTADGLVDMLDVQLIKWLVRCIGNNDVTIGQEPTIEGGAQKKAGIQPSTLP